MECLFSFFVKIKLSLISTIAIKVKVLIAGSSTSAEIRDFKRENKDGGKEKHLIYIKLKLDLMLLR